MYGIRDFRGRSSVMPGPTPLAPGERRRRNADGNFQALTTPSGPPPALPDRPNGRPWPPRVVAWWASATSSPVATLWHHADMPVLQRYAELMALWGEHLAAHDRAIVAKKTNAAVVVPKVPTWIATHMLRIEDHFGLNEASRRRLRVTIGPAEPPEPPAPPRPARPRDPRLALVPPPRPRPQRAPRPPRRVGRT